MPTSLDQNLVIILAVTAVNALFVNPVQAINNMIFKAPLRVSCLLTHTAVMTVPLIYHFLREIDYIEYVCKGFAELRENFFLT